MGQHSFIFSSGNWSGKGKVTFNVSPDEVSFETVWSIGENRERGILCEQQVNMQGVDENIHNHFRIFDVTEKGFGVELENHLVGLVQGKGIIDGDKFGWEFHGNGELEGFEMYELQADGSYHLHAEYSSPDQFRTIIDGCLKKM